MTEMHNDLQTSVAELHQMLTRFGVSYKVNRQEVDVYEVALSVGTQSLMVKLSRSDSSPPSNGVKVSHPSTIKLLVEGGPQKTFAPNSSAGAWRIFGAWLRQVQESHPVAC
jgi:hypothetical protein